MSLIWDWIKNKKLRNKVLKWREEDNIVIVYGETLEICYLNKIAGIILFYSDGQHTLEDIEKNLLARFQVDKETLESDLIEIIRNLQWKRLLVLEE